MRKAVENARTLAEEFKRVLEVEWELPEDLAKEAQNALSGCADWTMVNPAARKRLLLGLVNTKLKLTKSRFQHFLDSAAAQEVYFNYHEKAEIQAFIDNADVVGIRDWLAQKGLDHDLSKLFDAIPERETLEGLHEQLKTGAVTRKDARKCDVSERRDEVLRSLFGSFAFNAYPVEAMHRYFNEDCRVSYVPNFYDHLLEFHPNSLSRKRALVFLCVDDLLRQGLPPAELRARLCCFIRETYERLANHCFLGILIKPFHEGNEDGQWKLFADLVLYAEKHREVTLEAGYFHPGSISRATASYVPTIDLEAARFDIANEGFFFRDCFVISDDKDVRVLGSISKSHDPVDLLLLFEKNERDETVIPCPGCRSMAYVSGNSYPALGVRSWECRNPICPDRSAFDRGNRYSLSALIKQEAINSEADQIPDQSLRAWKLDVVHGIDTKIAVEMLLRHFSLHGDTALVVNGPDMGSTCLGRTMTYERFAVQAFDADAYSSFQDSAFFHRFVIDRMPTLKPGKFKPVCPKNSDAEIYHGDCITVLGSMPGASVDGAVTSPPYYNARSYTTWPNIYCYLYDMYNSAQEVYRVLKPGAVYLFNIFDYFDNENTLVFSAMGKKRMILGAYIVNLFERIGFEVGGNVVWHKGEIEGKRNFNQGNKSPYYQYPFNCWEHTFVFRKPGPGSTAYTFPSILAAKPVFKMIRGENVLGHSAPFPTAIPELLIQQMKPHSVVLDPFGGSMTTARTAAKYGLRSVSIEMHEEYCLLGKRLLEEEAQMSFIESWESQVAALG